MEISVVARSKVTRGLIEHSANFYAKQLGLANSRYKLTIYAVPDIRKKHNANGMVNQIDDRELILGVYSRLDMYALFQTLAHEMVHVKQLAKGQLKYHTQRNGKVVFKWLGKTYKKDYYDSPWELEAFGRQHLLANKINQLLIKG